MGGSFEAYQMASTIRTYLDSNDIKDTKILLIEEGPSEI